MKNSKFKKQLFYLGFKNTFFLALICLFSCSGYSSQHKESSKQPINKQEKEFKKDSILTGAQQIDAYLPLLQNKKIGFVGNQTSVLFTTRGLVHVVDSLLARGVDIQAVFSPEHGFRGTASAGEWVQDEVDQQTGIRIVSLYGSNKKPKSEDLKSIDYLVFDIQDVGLRFYTYISTLHYIMEAAAENDIPVLVLDRPNPNGNYIDGPLLEEKHKSFVGMHPVPVVHGMTIGEYAQMINGEHWLKNGVKADLTVVKVQNYSKEMPYSLPVKPSPNLPNDQAINLYPSLCFFEGTNVNAGRGTTYQFQVFGSPYLDSDHFDFQYTPIANSGAAHPKHENELCYGKDLRAVEKLNYINLDWLLEAYENTADKTDFFNSFFENLAGTNRLRKQIIQGYSTDEIRDSWKTGLKEYDEMRKNYLLY